MPWIDALIVALEEAVIESRRMTKWAVVRIDRSGPGGSVQRGYLTTEEAYYWPPRTAIRGSRFAREFVEARNMRDMRASMNAGLLLHEMDKPTIAMINGTLRKAPA